MAAAVAFLFDPDAHAEDRRRLQAAPALPYDSGRSLREPITVDDIQTFDFIVDGAGSAASILADAA